MLATEARRYWAFLEWVIYRISDRRLADLAEMEVAQEELTYGGLKNCSKTTYIPLIISVKRKYLPALSKELSLASSHRSFRGSLNPVGGGPRGVAERNADVEKAAGEIGDDALDIRKQVADEYKSLELVNMVNGRTVAIFDSRISGDRRYQRLRINRSPLISWSFMEQATRLVTIICYTDRALASLSTRIRRVNQHQLLRPE